MLRNILPLATVNSLLCLSISNCAVVSLPVNLSIVLPIPAVCNALSDSINVCSISSTSAKAIASVYSKRFPASSIEKPKLCASGIFVNCSPSLDTSASILSTFLLIKVEDILLRLPNPTKPRSKPALPFINFEMPFAFAGDFKTSLPDFKALGFVPNALGLVPKALDPLAAPAVPPALLLVAPQLNR